MPLTEKHVTVESVQAEWDELDKNHKARSKTLKALIRALKAERGEPVEEPVTD